MKTPANTQAAINREHLSLRSRLGDLVHWANTYDGRMSERLQGIVDDSRALLKKINAREEREERASAQAAKKNSSDGCEKCGATDKALDCICGAIDRIRE